MLSLKGNQSSLQDDVSVYFTSTLSPDVAVVSIDGDHGRIETRTVRVTDEIDWLKERHTWTGLASILAVTATRESGHKVTKETRYFISSLPANDPTRLERAVRAHWSIENNLHGRFLISLLTKIGTELARVIVRPISLLSGISLST